MDGPVSPAAVHAGPVDSQGSPHSPLGRSYDHVGQKSAKQSRGNHLTHRMVAEALLLPEPLTHLMETLLRPPP